MEDSSPTPPPPTWEGLLELGRILRGPDGCPWDRKQTLQQLAGHLVEESYEVLQAATEGEPGRVSEELGDLAFVLALVFGAAEEAGGSPFPDVAQGAVEKIVRRHPHVFGPDGATDPDAAARQWERIKQSERNETSLPPGALPEPAPALPALLQSYRLQQKAAGVGFDWPSPEPVYDKVREELGELREAAGSDGPDAGGRIAEEMGDLLFAAVNLSRALGMDPEACLRGANRKFRNRFNTMAAIAAEEHTPMETLGLEALDKLWNRVKNAASSRSMEVTPGSRQAPAPGHSTDGTEPTRTGPDRTRPD